jgi:recombination protein RecR
LGYEDVLPGSIKEALEKITKIPTYGERGAVRLLYNFFKLPREERLEIVEALKEAGEKVQPCRECHLLTEGELCNICSDRRRSRRFICVVEESQDAYAIEKLERYKGVYHVLGGRIAPLEGISPQDLNIDSLLDRIAKYRTKEVIIATNPNAEGEATANYLLRIIRDRFPSVKCSRISYGLQFGSLLEFVDEASLEKSFENRK